jgi:hypothetical protein
VDYYRSGYGGWLRLLRPHIVTTQKSGSHKSLNPEKPLPTMETMLSNQGQNNKNPNTHHAILGRAAK